MNTNDVENAYHDVCCYTLGLQDPEFIHQLVVDAYQAQTASAGDKTIGLCFSLVGLYLHVELGWTGKQVQVAHMKLAKSQSTWPRFTIPTYRGQIDATDVLLAEPGSRRNDMIHKWCVAVWDTYGHCQEQVRALLSQHQIA